MTNELTDIILKVARIPSFTSYEHKLHPLIEEFCKEIGVELQFIEGNNILIEVPGIGDNPIALSAHLDKNNYCDAAMPQEEIFATCNGEYLHGLMDDAAGVGVCLHLLKQSATRKFPPLQILLSECEESMGFDHPDLLKDRGENIMPGIGAQRLSNHLIKNDKVPAAVIVIDVTDHFNGDKGIALYSRPWEMNNTKPTEELLEMNNAMVAKIKELCSRAVDSNNKNDYLKYASELNQEGRTVPCFALEPSVHNYHSAKEEIFVDDVMEIADVLSKFMEDFAVK